MIDCLCSLLPLLASSIIGPVVGGIIGGFSFAIMEVTICSISGIVSIKHHKSCIQTSKRQKIEHRTSETIQSNIASHPLPQQPSPSYPHKPPAQYPYLEAPAGYTVYHDQKIKMELMMLMVPPPPSYDDFYKN